MNISSQTIQTISLSHLTRQKKGWDGILFTKLNSKIKRSKGGFLSFTLYSLRNLTRKSQGSPSVRCLNNKFSTTLLTKVGTIIRTSETHTTVWTGLEHKTPRVVYEFRHGRSVTKQSHQNDVSWLCSLCVGR